jgi:hypothetical protein
MLGLPSEVTSLVKENVRAFRHYSFSHIVENYRLSRFDIIGRIKGKNLGVLEGKNSQEFQTSHFMQHRAGVLQHTLNGLHQKYPEEANRINLTIPICLADATDIPFQEIPALAFSKAAFSSNIPIPSINNILGYTENSIVNYADKPFFSKDDGLCFVSSITGSTDTDEAVKNNQRLQVAAKMGYSLPGLCRLIKPPKIDPQEYEEILQRVTCMFPSLPKSIFLDERYSLPEQLKYKYQICVDGHSCAWARLPWQMLSNSVVLKIRNPRVSWEEWYYPLLNPSRHFLEIDLEDLEEAYNFLQSHPDVQHDLAYSGREFVETYLTQDVAEKVFLYTLLLLSEKQDNSYDEKVDN